MCLTQTIGQSSNISASHIFCTQIPWPHVMQFWLCLSKNPIQIIRRTVLNVLTRVLYSQTIWLQSQIKSHCLTMKMKKGDNQGKFTLKRSLQFSKLSIQIHRTNHMIFTSCAHTYLEIKMEYTSQLFKNMFSFIS
jgi:hypothetical protein